MNFGAFGKSTTPTATAVPAGGLKPSSFQLQMGNFQPRSAIGFAPGAEKLAAQVMQGATQPATTQTSTPPAAAPEDPWKGFGILGGFFQWLDNMRTENGMPSLTENKALMDHIRYRLPGAGMPPAGVSINDGMSSGGA